jgi:uncharacterized membrane protein YphA (DoxX/SURF4 family)
MSKIEKFSKFSPIFLRLGIASVFLWFGFSQIKNPASWIRMMPEYVQSIINISPNTLIYINGIFEIALAILLLLGLYTRTVSLLLGLHLLHIVSIVGYGAIGARDFALVLATFAIFLHGPDEFCLDKIRIVKKEEKRGNI